VLRGSARLVPPKEVPVVLWGSAFDDAGASLERAPSDVPDDQRTTASGLKGLAWLIWRPVCYTYLM
jgi:hypothetical protein